MAVGADGMEGLDEAVREVLSRREFQWRLPREERAGMELEAPSWLNDIGNTLLQWRDAAWEWLKEARDWIWGRDPGDAAAAQVGSSSSPMISDVLLVLSLAAFGVLAFIILRRALQPKMITEAPSLPVVPDLEDEAVLPDALPGDAWRRMALEHAGRGEYRPALRALFLAMLSEMAAASLIRVQRFKSNREYLRELGRKGHGMAGLEESFREMTFLVEGVWYGCHEASEEAYLRAEPLSKAGVRS